MRGQVRWVEKTTPYSQPGLGMAMLAGMVWLMVALFRLTVVVAKWTIIAVAAVVAAIVGWLESRR